MKQSYTIYAYYDTDLQETRYVLERTGFAGQVTDEPNGTALLDLILQNVKNGRLEVLLESGEASAIEAESLSYNDDQ